jgi:hypothetical protein
MARIAFFIEQLPPHADDISTFAYELIRSLADQHHDIRIFSTYHEKKLLPKSHPRIEILRPFQTWSWLEALRVIPLLMEFRPEILHLIQPSKKMTKLVPRLATKWLDRPSILSLFELFEEAQFQEYVALAKASTLVSVRHEKQKQFLIRNGVAAAKIHILPLNQRPSSGYSKPELQSGLTTFLEQFPTFFYLPGPLHESEFLSFLPEKPFYGVVVGGALSQLPLKEREQFQSALQKKGWGARIFFTGEPSPELEFELLKKARGVLGLGLRSDSLSFLRLLRAALQAPAALVLSKEQASFDPLPWRHAENVWLYDSVEGPKRAIQILLETESTHETLRQGALELGYRQASDDPGNLLSRLYADMLNLGVCLD